MHWQRFAIVTMNQTKLSMFVKKADEQSWVWMSKWRNNCTYCWVFKFEFIKIEKLHVSNYYTCPIITRVQLFGRLMAEIIWCQFFSSSVFAVSQFRQEYLAISSPILGLYSWLAQFVSARGKAALLNVSNFWRGKKVLAKS